jgi:hypothetical protein
MPMSMKKYVFGLMIATCGVLSASAMEPERKTTEAERRTMENKLNNITGNEYLLGQTSTFKEETLNLFIKSDNSRELQKQEDELMAKVEENPSEMNLKALNDFWANTKT